MLGKGQPPRPTFDRDSGLNRICNLIYKKKLYAQRSQPVDQLMRLHPVCTQRDVRHRRPANVREQRKTGPTEADGRLSGEARTINIGAADVIDRLWPYWPSSSGRMTGYSIDYRGGVFLFLKPRGSSRRMVAPV